MRSEPHSLSDNEFIAQKQRLAAELRHRFAESVTHIQIVSAMVDHRAQHADGKSSVTNSFCRGEQCHATGAIATRTGIATDWTRLA
jgi:hypothetical protein